MGFQRILCPVDFSEASADAARYAAVLADRNRADLTLLHVAPPFDLEFSMVQPASDRLLEIARHRTEVAGHALDLFPGGDPLAILPKRELVQGDAAEAIVETANAGSYDLIVMSTHGSGAIRRWLLVGSVTTKVLHASKSATIAATDFSRRSAQFRRIVCGVDLGVNSRRVLCSAAGLAREAGAALTVVHAAPDYGEHMQDFVNEEWRSTLLTRCREKLEALLRETSTNGEIVVEAGNAHAILPQVAERSSADLLVIGRGVHTGVIGRLRAAAYEIIRNSPCPVLSI
jgi:nucleotide-binding universal stress UspA family protein